MIAVVQFILKNILENTEKIVLVASLLANLIKYMDLLNKIYDFKNRVKADRKRYYQTAFDRGGFEQLVKCVGGGEYCIMQKLQYMKEWLNRHRTYNNLLPSISVHNLTDNIKWVDIDYFDDFSTMISKNWLLKHRFNKLTQEMRKIWTNGRDIQKEPKLNKATRKKLCNLITKLLQTLQKIYVKYDLDNHNI